MDMNFTKLMGPVALSLVAFTGILNAADDMKMRNLDNRVTSLEQKKGAGGMINPPARPVVKDGSGLFFSGEVLVWKAHQDDMGYAIKLNSPTNSLGPNSGKIANWKGKWAAGFRLGLGYNMCHDGWDTDLIWTRFHTKSTRHSTGNRHGIFAPNYILEPFASVGSDSAEEAHDKKWKLNLDLLDLELGREFFVSKWLTLRPHAGLRSAWVRQRTAVEYEDGDYGNIFVNTFVPGANATYTDMKNSYKGIGLRGGLDSQWGLGSGFSFYGKLALSVLWGQFKVREIASAMGESVTTTVVNNFSDMYHACRSVADLALGIRYDYLFNDAFSMGVLAGWEHHYFWSQNRLFKFLKQPYKVGRNNGDLSTSGVNVGLVLDF